MKRQIAPAFLLAVLAVIFASCSPGQDTGIDAGIPQETLVVMQATLDAYAPKAAATAQAWMTEVSPQSGDPEGDSLPANLQAGGIRGRLSYPDGERIPLTVIAFNIETGEYYSVDVKDESRYRLENLPVGQYRVVAYTHERQPRAGAYTQAVICGLRTDCADHSLILVQVKVDEVSEDIDPQDWNVPADQVPPYSFK